MNIQLISRMTITCPDCGTTISCGLSGPFQNDFVCPVCGESMNGNFDDALRKAISFNKAAMEIIECQREYMVDFAVGQDTRKWRRQD